MCLYHGNKPDEGEGRIHEYAMCVQGRALVLSKKLLLFAGDRKVIFSLPYKLALLVWSHKKQTEKRGLICIEKVEKLLRRIPKSHVYHQTLLISQRFSKHIPKLNGVTWGGGGRGFCGQITLETA